MDVIIIKIVFLYTVYRKLISFIFFTWILGLYLNMFINDTYVLQWPIYWENKDIF